MIDLDLKNLPKDTTDQSLKNLIDAKHIVSVTTEQDKIQNYCKGTGRVKIRMTKADDINKITQSIVKRGIVIDNHAEKHAKKSNYNDLVTDFADKGVAL